MLRSMLQQKREERVRPGLDDKVLADWNGLMIAALANAGAMLGETEWIALGARAFDFIAKRHDHAATGSAIPGARANCSIPVSPRIMPP